MELTLKTAPSFKDSIFSARLKSGELVLAFTKDENIIFNHEDDFQKNLVLLIDGKNSVCDIYNILLQKGFNCTLEDVFFVIRNLYDRYLIEIDKPDETEHRYSR